MLTRAEIKTNAKHALEGKWGKGALITLCYVVFFFALGFVTGLLKFIPLIGLVVQIAEAVIQIPLALGLTFSFIKLKRGEEVGPFDFFTLGFNNFKKAWAIVGNTLLKMIVPIIIMVVILGAMIFFSVLSVGSLAGGSYINSKGSSFDLNAYRDSLYDYDYDYDFDIDDVSYNPYARSSSSSSSSLRNRATSADLSAGLIGLSIGSIIAVLVFSLAYVGVSIWATCKGLYYALAQFIAFDNPNMTGKEVVQRSEDLMKGNRGRLFIFNLSFIGWAILAGITLGIGMFWLLPYMMVSLVCFYETVSSEKNGASAQNNTNTQNNNMNNGMNPNNNQFSNMNGYNNQPQGMPEQNNNVAPSAPDMNQYNNSNPNIDQNNNGMNNETNDNQNNNQF